MDMFGKLPLCLIETILSHLTTKEAVRTSILSRDWRYHWTKIPKLEFIEEAIEVPANTEAELSERCKLFYRALLMHEDPIYEFTLSINTNSKSCAEIDRILFHLSGKNTVKKLRLGFNNYYKLPISFFSFRHLTGLCIKDCNLDDPPTFSVFSSLTSLSLEGVYIYNKTLLHLLSNCPLLKTLVVTSCAIHSKGSCYNVPDSGDDPTVISLFECLPVIESLSISFKLFKYFIHDRDLRELPSVLIHLKYLCVDRVFTDYWVFTDNYEVFTDNTDVSTNLNLLIRSAPNLEILKILEPPWSEREVMYSSTLEDYSNMWLEHLNELEITIFGSEKSWLDFVKLVLAKSPQLKKVGIRLHKRDANAEEYAEANLLRLSGILKGFRSASLKAYIDLEVVCGQAETQTITKMSFYAR